MARKKLQIIQSIQIDKDYAPSLATAKAWVKQMGGRVSDVDETENFWRFRQHDPVLFVNGTFRTHHEAHGVRSLVARPRPEFREAFLSVIHE